MDPEKHAGPVCQSCGMPMEKPEDHGSNSDGTQSDDYCHFCYTSGSFTAPDLNMEHMIYIYAGIMGAKMLMPDDKAKEMADSVIPGLKRWKDK